MSENKIKGTIYLNFKNKSEEKKKKINDWLQNQENQTNSILSLIEHAIDRFGNRDIMDHSISKKLHTEILFFNEEGNASPLFPIYQATKNSKKEPLQKDLKPIENYHEKITNMGDREEQKLSKEEIQTQENKFTNIEIENF